MKSGTRIAPLPRSLGPIFPSGVSFFDPATSKQRLLTLDEVTSHEAINGLSESSCVALELALRTQLKHRIKSNEVPAVELTDLFLPSNPQWAARFSRPHQRLLKGLGVIHKPKRLQKMTLAKFICNPIFHGPVQIIGLLKAIEDECFRCQSIRIPQSSAPVQVLQPLEIQKIDQLLKSGLTESLTSSDIRFGHLIKQFAPRVRKLREALSFLSGNVDLAELPEVDRTMARTYVLPLVEAIDRANKLTAAAEFREVGSALAALTFRDHPERAAQLFAERYGVLGEEKATLQSIGDRYRLTRERVRQITDKMIERGTFFQYYLPAVSVVVEKAEKFSLIQLSELDLALRQHLGEDLSIGGILRFHEEMLRKPIPIEISSARKGLLETPIVRAKGAGGSWAGMANQSAIQMISQCGAAQVSWVYACVAEFVGANPPPRDAVANYLQALPGFAWIDQKRQWFWFGAVGNNRILSYTRKILSVATRRVDIESLFEGVGRYHRERYEQVEHETATAMPSIPILRKILATTPGFVCTQSNFFEAMPALDPKSELSDDEYRVYSALVRCQGTASRLSLRKELVDAGTMGAVSFSLIIDQSPILRQIDRGVVVLRGWPIDSARLMKSQSEVGGDSRPGVPKGKKRGGLKLPEYVVGSDRKPWFIRRLVPAFFLFDTVKIPTALRRIITNGAYSFANDGGRIHVERDAMHGLVPIARRMGLGANEFILLAIDIDGREISMSRYVGAGGGAATS